MSSRSTGILLVFLLYFKFADAGEIIGTIISPVQQMMEITRLNTNDRDTFALQPGLNVVHCVYRSEKSDLFIVRYSKKGGETFLILKGEDVTFNTELSRDNTIESCANNIVISGSVTTQRYNEHLKYLYLNKEFGSFLVQEKERIQRRRDSLYYVKIEKQLSDLQESRISYLTTSIRQSDDPTLAYLLMLTLKLSKTASDSLMDTLYSEAVSRFDSSYFKRFKPGVENGPPPGANIKIGSPLIDFQIPDSLGNNHKISEWLGKYVLVDFWASWCVPCREETPYLKKAFNLFKQNNFVIVGISLDKNKENWLRAIRDDGLEEWANLSDLNGSNSFVIKQFDITKIPFNVLLGPDGKVLAKSLRGDELIKTLDQFLDPGKTQSQ